MVENIVEGIYRIRIPFENIYTTSFLLTEGQDAVVLDSGCADVNVEDYIIPVISELGVCIKYIVFSHLHGDHYGGRRALVQNYPDAQVCVFAENISGIKRICDGEMLLGRYQILHLPGHCDESLGMLDTLTNTLLSGDSLQMCGVGRFGTALSNLDFYLATLDRVRKMKVTRIVASHEYVPCGSIVEGERVAEFLEECEIAVSRILDFARNNSQVWDKEFLKLFNEAHPQLPTLNVGVMRWLQFHDCNI